MTPNRSTTNKACASDWWKACEYLHHHSVWHEPAVPLFRLPGGTMTIAGEAA